VEELAVLLLQWLVEFLFQILLQGGLEVLWELASSSYKLTYGRENHHPAVAAMGYFLVGAVLGGFSLLLWPDRIFQPGPIPGISLLLSPLGAGVALHAWGVYRRRSGHVTTNLATFVGGAAFAFGTALVRFVWAS
jgi:hypothetical protein